MCASSVCYRGVFAHCSLKRVEINERSFNSLKYRTPPRQMNNTDTLVNYAAFNDILAEPRLPVPTYNNRLGFVVAFNKSFVKDSTRLLIMQTQHNDNDSHVS